jgi:hypothetical protein
MREIILSSVESRAIYAFRRYSHLDTDAFEMRLRSVFSLRFKLHDGNGGHNCKFR